MKTFPAELADEWFVSCVDACVRVEGGAAVEGFPALVTLVWFFLLKRDENSVISHTYHHILSSTLHFSIDLTYYVIF